jgi:hypothetical protein
MDWGALVGSVVQGFAPVVAKVVESAMSSNAMTPEQAALLDVELAEMVTALRKDAFARAADQEARNKVTKDAMDAKFPKDHGEILK